MKALWYITVGVLLALYFDHAACINDVVTLFEGL